MQYGRALWKGRAADIAKGNIQKSGFLSSLKSILSLKRREVEHEERNAPQQRETDTPVVPRAPQPACKAGQHLAAALLCRHLCSGSRRASQLAWSNEHAKVHIAARHVSVVSKRHGCLSERT